MAENAGKLEIEYVVISDTAVRRLERMQKQLEKVEDAANKQSKSIEASFKKSGKTMAVFGTIATGVLYGLIRASAYSAMWLDQISHQMTRISTKILEILGLDEAIEGFIKLLDNLADELINPEENDFWKRLGEDWDVLSTKAKIASITIAALVAVLTGITFAAIIIKIASFVKLLAATTLGAKSLAIVVGILKASLVFLGSTIGILIIIAVVLIALFTKWWLQTKDGQAAIQSLINIWNNFKDNISDLGFIGAIIQALKDCGYLMLYNFVHTIRWLYDASVEFKDKMVDYAYEIGKGIITYLVNGLKNLMPWVKDQFWYIYDNFWDIMEIVKTLAYNKAIEIYKWLVKGFNDALQWVKNAFSKVTNLWNIESGTVLIAANKTGVDIIEETAKGIDKASPALEVSTKNAGTRASDGLRDGIGGAGDSVCGEMINAVDCVSTGVDGINDEIGRIITDIQIKANMSMDAGEYVAGGYGWKLSGWKNSDGGGGEYVAAGTGWKLSGWKNGGGSGGGGSGGGGWGLSGWKNSSATGGHVMRTGMNTVHQGEDIVNLKSLLSGIKSDGGNKTGDIVINPVINITSGNISDPFEANRIADVVSKRMGDELRRITTSI